MLLRSFESFEKTENGYLIHGDAADVKLIFMTDDIIRIRVNIRLHDTDLHLVLHAIDDLLHLREPSEPQVALDLQHLELGPQPCPSSSRYGSPWRYHPSHE